MKAITAFFKNYTAIEYRRLGRAMIIAWKAIFYRRDPESNVHWNVYDHGVFWRVLRDLWITFATFCRAGAGICIVASVLLLILPAAAGRAILIPFLGAWKGYYLDRKVGKARGTDRR